MPQSFACLHAHIIFSTKSRAPWIGPDLAPRLYDYIGGIVRVDGSALVAAGGMPDHIHLLVSLGREVSAAETVRRVKSNSSRWVHETFPGRREFAWQTGYGAFAVSYSHVGRVRGNIARQEGHHKTRTFQDEFREFLRRHGIACDERYVWD